MDWAKTSKHADNQPLYTSDHYDWSTAPMPKVYQCYLDWAARRESVALGTRSAPICCHGHDFLSNVGFVSVHYSIGYSRITASECEDACVPGCAAVSRLNGESVWKDLGEIELRKGRAGVCSVELLSAATYELTTLHQSMFTLGQRLHSNMFLQCDWDTG